MKKLIGIALTTCALVTACGGGGGDSIGASSPPAASTYMKSGGLTWSATTSLKVLNPVGFNNLGSATLEATARGYCGQQTCDQDGKTNCRWTNFNGEPGWRVSSFVELKALYATNPRPAGWTLGPTWGENGLQLDFMTGQTIVGGDGSKALVTCVKPA